MSTFSVDSRSIFSGRLFCNFQNCTIQAENNLYSFPETCTETTSFGLRNSSFVFYKSKFPWNIPL